MLGVLAVVGVLSVGGIAGYQYAINKHRANAIFYTVSEMAVVASSQLLSGNDLNLASFGDDIDGLYPFGWNGNYSGTKTDFSIDVSQIPIGVCEHIKNRELKMSFLTLINGKQAGDCQSELNTVEFVFNDNLNRGSEKERTSCTTDNDCAQAGLSSGYKCNTTLGICEITCGNNQTYVDGFGCCPNNALWNGGCCSGPNATLMEEDGVLVCYSTTTGTGCPEGQIYDTNSKSCIDCTDVTGVIRNGYFAVCGMCPNLVQVSKWQCAPTCTDPDAIVVDGVCKCPLDRPLLPEKTSSNPQCLPCDYNGGTGWEPPYGGYSTIFTGYYCNRRNGGGYSDYCAPGTVGVSINQTIILNNGSVYKESNQKGTCKPCSEVDVSALAYQASCESCGGTWFGDSWDSGTCQP